jgi:hypothetical protein
MKKNTVKFRGQTGEMVAGVSIALLFSFGVFTIIILLLDFLDKVVK